MDKNIYLEKILLKTMRDKQNIYLWILDSRAVLECKATNGCREKDKHVLVQRKRLKKPNLVVIAVSEDFLNELWQITTVIENVLWFFIFMEGSMLKNKDDSRPLGLGKRLKYLPKFVQLRKKAFLSSGKE